MSIKEECGIVGVYGNSEAAKITRLCLHALQHRGQESAGIVSSHEERHFLHKNKGLVNEVFNEENIKTLEGNTAIGHVRYSTTGSNRIVNAQPISVNYKRGYLSLAHNGNFTNSFDLRKELENKGAIFTSTNDTEILVHLIAQHHSSDFFKSLTCSLMDLEGAFSLVALHQDYLIAVRDRRGIRPLCLGELPDGTKIIASESCAFDIVGASFLRDIEAGEMIIINKEGVTSKKIFPHCKGAFCIFEYIYIMRPDSLTTVDGELSNVFDIRYKLGEQLAEEYPLEADVIIDVPDSARPAALGYAKKSGIPYSVGLTRSHYINRTFIEPEQKIRDYKARLKYGIVRSVVQGKRVVVIDDSIVRGLTSEKIVRMLREAGAAKIHFLSTAPPWKFPCYYGVDTPDPSKFIGNIGDSEKIAGQIGADSIYYLSMKGLLKAMPKVDFCRACFDGRYTSGKSKENFKKEETE